VKSAAAVIAAASQALKPPPRQSLSMWAEEKFRLSADAGAAEPGRWRTLPFQRGWMDAMTDPRNEQVSVIKSTRVGYTESIKALIGYHVDYDPCPVMVIQPTENDAKGFAKENIEPMLRDCPAVGDKFGAKSRDSLLLKRFRGGVLDIVGARAPGNFRRKGRRLILGDEIDGYPLDAGGEGDPLSLAWKRAEAFWNRKRVLGSTPKDAGTSRIEQEFFDGDQRRYYVPCPHCQQMQLLQFKNLRWPGGQPELAVFVCIHCGCEIEHARKPWMVERGEWRPGPHAQFPNAPAPKPWHGHASFHIWAAYSLLPNTTWGHIATEFVKANAAGADQLKTFINTWLGETWQAKGEAPAWERLYDRRETYAAGTCPRGVLFLTAGVDVQPNRLVYEVVGWGRDKESWSISAEVFSGDTSDLSPGGPWSHIDALLERTFRHELGPELRIRMLAVDSGDQTQVVYNYVRSRPGRVMAVKGADIDVTVSPPSKVDVMADGTRVGSLMLHRVSTRLTKSELYGWLRLRMPTDEERAKGARTPPGYCHFHQQGEEYFKQLTGEHQVDYKDARGFTIRVWEMIPGRENHWMDARRYARAAAASVGLDVSKDSDWQALERMLGELAAKPPEPPPVSSAPAAAPSPSPAQPPRKATRRSATWTPS
jgi:phage terminase large subunit GpA-like protein